MGDKAQLFSCAIVPVLSVNIAAQAVLPVKILQEVGFTALEATLRTTHGAAAYHLNHRSRSHA